MIFQSQEILIKKNQTELRVKLINESEIRFVSGEVFDNLRGETLNGVIIDEVRDQHPDLWKLVIRPMLTTTKGWATFISTPRGFDNFYDLFKIAEKDKNWESFKSPSTCNPLFTIEELEESKRIMSEAEFAQEILAEFRDLQKGRTYVSFSQENIVERNPFYEKSLICPYLPIILGCDFNLSPMSWHLGQFREGVNEWFWFGEHHLNETHTQKHAIDLIEKFPEILDHEAGFIICGDATSKAGQRAAAGQSDYDILIQTLKDRGVKNIINKTPESNPLVRDRVNIVNSFFKNAYGQKKMFIHKSCVHLIEDLERTLWKENNAVLDEGHKKERTHASDSIGYPVCALSPRMNNNEILKPRVMFRSVI